MIAQYEDDDGKYKRSGPRKTGHKPRVCAVFRAVEPWDTAKGFVMAMDVECPYCGGSHRFFAPMRTKTPILRGCRKSTIGNSIITKFAKEFLICKLIPYVEDPDDYEYEEAG